MVPIAFLAGSQRATDVLGPTSAEETLHDTRYQGVI
jgi:hypothetical protein